MEITERPKALLEEYNKTVSLSALAGPLRSAVWSPGLFYSIPSSVSHQPVCLFPAPPTFRQRQTSFFSLSQILILTLTCDQTMLLSKQFVQWDELLCQLEAAKQVKPVEE